MESQTLTFTVERETKMLRPRFGGHRSSLNQAASSRRWMAASAACLGVR